MGFIASSLRALGTIALFSACLSFEAGEAKAADQWEFVPGSTLNGGTFGAGGPDGTGGGGDGTYNWISLSWKGSSDAFAASLTGLGDRNFDLPTFAIEAQSGYTFIGVALAMNGGSYIVGSGSTTQDASASFTAGGNGGSLLANSAYSDEGNAYWTLNPVTWFSNPTTSFSFDGGTLRLTAESGGGFSFTNVALRGGPEILVYYTTAVPEPAEWALLAAGLALVAFSMRRRRTGSSVAQLA